MNNYQIGGWYNGQQWDGNHLGPKGQVIVGQSNNNKSSSGTDLGDPMANQIYGHYAGAENDYYNKLVNQAQGNRDAALKILDAQHKLAVGGNDDATAKFLESVANTDEANQGRIPFDYNRLTTRENTGYGIQSGQIATNRQQALNQLAEDERSGLANIGLQQGQGNQQTAEDLNSRGLLTGSTPTGLTGGAPTTQQLGGIQGVGSYGALANNTGFANQRTALQNSIGLQNTGIQNQYGQAQQNLNFSHANTLNDLTTNARRDTQDAQNTYQLGQLQPNLTFNALQTQLENQRRQALQTDAINSKQYAGMYGNGALGYLGFGN
jgi:hypothetical protein